MALPYLRQHRLGPIVGQQRSREFDGPSGAVTEQSNAFPSSTATNGLAWLLRWTRKRRFAVAQTDQWCEPAGRLFYTRSNGCAPQNAMVRRLDDAADTRSGIRQG